MSTPKPIIEIKNVGKRYNIEHQQGGYVALRDVLANVFKNPFSFLKSKAKKAIGLEKKEAFWALKDISFEVMPGEVIGIIGGNGAGKSTLLKILSGITPPTEGEIVMRGRVSSLLEVGTGFHPELTGRENIFLNGAILGMTQKEITRKFDQIVEFSGVGKFLDTPVKHYSSGMQVRLAFSVAAHMEPDILIVDEVLAVGDAEFQKKCMGKMEEVTKKDGRTILFVSHNLAAIQQLCKKTVLLNHGSMVSFGETKEILETYTEKNPSFQTSLRNRTDRRGNGKIRLVNYKFCDLNHKTVNNFKAGDDIILQLEYEKEDNKELELDVSVGIDALPFFVRLITISTKLTNKKILVEKKVGYIDIVINRIPVNYGKYQLSVSLEDTSVFDWIIGVGEFEVLKGNFYPSGKLPEQTPLLIDFEIKNG